MTVPDQTIPLPLPRANVLAWQSNAIVVTVVSLAALWMLRVAHAPADYAHLAGMAAVCCALAIAAWGLGAVTPAGAITGALLSLSMTLAVPAAAGWWRSPLVPMLVLFALTHVATSFRRERKAKLGLAETEAGRRASQVAANVGIAALVLPAMGAHGWVRSIPTCFFCEAAGLPALVAALAEAAADTVSSEMGQALSGQARLITTGRRVAPGTDGAVSIAGSLAGSVAAAIVVLVSMPVLNLRPMAAAIAFAGAIFGLFFDSLLGATLERRGWLNNDAVNFFSTVAAALLAGWLVAVTTSAR